MSRDDELQDLLDCEAIRHLAARYFLGLDSKDVSAIAGMFAAESEFGRSGRGPQGAQVFYQKTLRHFVASMHVIGYQVINQIAGDSAHGVLHCRSYQYREGGTWWEVAFAYHDDYVRENGEWLFLRRVPHYWYRDEISPGGERTRVILTSDSAASGRAGARGQIASNERIVGAGEFHEALPTWYPYWQADQ